MAQPIAESAPSSDKNKELRDYVRNCFDISYSYMTTDHNGDGSYADKAQRACMAYDGILDLGNWQQQSEIYMPFARTAVEVFMPAAMDFLFHHHDLFELVPLDSSVGKVDSRLVTEAVLYQLNTQMNIYMAALPTLKDAAKLGVGYGAIEARYINPYLWETMEIDDPQMGTKERVRELQKSTLAKPVPHYRYIPFGRGLPSPGGEPNMQDRDWFIWVDHIHEGELRAMIESENSPFTGDIDKIIMESRQNKMDGYASTLKSLYSKWCSSGNTFTEADMSRDYGHGNTKTPCLIPVIKFFGKDKQTWLANGETPILDWEDTVQTFRRPLVKASICPNSDEWFTDGIISGSEDMFTANNILYNMIIDWMSMLSKPGFVVDRSQIQGDLKLEPWGETNSMGPANNAVAPLPYPAMNPEVLQVSEQLRQIMNLSTGQSDAKVGQSGTGIVRGGSGALESLLQTTGAREKMSVTILEMGFMRDVIEQTLLLMQMTTEYEQEFTFQTREFEPPEGKGGKGSIDWKYQGITQDVLRNNFRVEMNLKKKLHESAQDEQMKFAKIQLMYTIPMLAQELDPQEVLHWIIGDELEYKKLTANASPEAYMKALMMVAAAGDIKRFGLGGGGGGGGSPAGGTMPVAGAGGANNSANTAKAAGVQG